MKNICNLQVLSFDESVEIDGGFWEIALGVIAVCGTVYVAGLAVGEALHYATL